MGVKKERNINLDIIRVIAVFSVISVHFLLNIGFYTGPITGKRMAVMVFIRTLFSVCVPLFILLTGYLMNRKPISKQYYLGIVRIIAIYLLASIAELLFRHFIDHEEMSLKQGVLFIFGFGASYSWYINMYIGLFLLIPFLNVLYQALDSQRKKQVLIGTLLILTVLPSLLNIFDFNTPGWWALPSTSTKFQPLVPYWWDGIYPLTYYYIGAYLKEYDWNIPKGLNVGIFVTVVVLFSGFNLYRSIGGIFFSGPYIDWGGFEPTILSVLLFVLILHIPTVSMPRSFRFLISKISELSLGAYLASYIVDRIVYGQLNKAIPDVPSRLTYFVVAVPCVIVGSLLLSLIYQLIYSSLQRAVLSIRGKLKFRNTHP